MVPNESDAKAHFGDDSYQNYIKSLLINSKEENIKDDFWQELENISKNFKYCKHCRIYDNKSFNSSSFE